MWNFAECPLYRTKKDSVSECVHSAWINHLMSHHWPAKKRKRTVMYTPLQTKKYRCTRQLTEISSSFCACFSLFGFVSFWSFFLSFFKVNINPPSHPPLPQHIHEVNWLYFSVIHCLLVNMYIVTYQVPNCVSVTPNKQKRKKKKKRYKHTQTELTVFQCELLLVSTQLWLTRCQTGWRLTSV